MNDENIEVLFYIIDENEKITNSITKYIPLRLIEASAFLKYSYQLLNNNKLIITSKGVQNENTLDIFLKLWDIIYTNNHIKQIIKSYKPYNFKKIFISELEFIYELNIYNCFHLIILANYLELSYIIDLLSILIAKYIKENNIPDIDHISEFEEIKEKLNMKEINEDTDIIIYNKITGL